MSEKPKRKPIIVNDPNDPRLKAYNDSLKLYTDHEKQYLTSKIEQLKNFTKYNELAEKHLSNSEKVNLTSYQLTQGRPKYKKEYKERYYKPEEVPKNKYEVSARFPLEGDWARDLLSLGKYESERSNKPIGYSATGDPFYEDVPGLSREQALKALNDKSGLVGDDIKKYIKEGLVNYPDRAWINFNTIIGERANITNKELPYANINTVTARYKKPVQPIEYQKPIKVNNPNDPRLKAYDDSLALYKNYKKPPLGYIPISQSNSVAAKDFKQSYSRRKEDTKGFYYSPNGSSSGNEAIVYYGVPPKKPVQPIEYQKLPPSEFETVTDANGNMTTQRIKKPVITTPVKSKSSIVKPVVKEEPKITKAKANVRYEQPPIFEITMLTGDKVSKKDFVKQYGEAAWNRATNKFEDGGFIPEGMREINIEKGELLVNPNNNKVIRSYVMQKPHNEKGKDPMVNFTIAPVGAAVIPQKWSKAYSNGDKLRRDTILRNLANKTMNENKFKTGGFIKTLGDIGMGYVNMAGAPLGIKPFEADKFYNQDIGNISSKLSDVSKQLAPVAAGIAFGPGASAGVMAAQQATQQFNSTPKYADGTSSIGGYPTPKKGFQVGDYSDPTGNKDWTYGYASDGLYGYKNGVGYNLSNNPKYKPSVDLFQSKYDEFQKAGGGGSGAWDKFLAGSSTSTMPMDNTYRVPNLYSTPQVPSTLTNNRPTGNTVLGGEDRGGNFNINKNMALAGAGALGNSVGSIYDMLWTKGGKRYDRENYGSVAPNLINSSEALNQSDISYNAGKENIRKLNPNGGGLLSAYSALASKRAAARAGIIQNTDNQNAGIKNQFAQYNKGLEVQGMIDTSQNKARSEDIFRKGLRDTSTNALMGVKDYQTGETNDMYLKMLAAKYGHLPAFQNFLTEANLNK